MGGAHLPVARPSGPRGTRGGACAGDGGRPAARGAGEPGSGRRPAGAGRGRGPSGRAAPGRRRGSGRRSLQAVPAPAPSPEAGAPRTTRPDAPGRRVCVRLGPRGTRPPRSASDPGARLQASGGRPPPKKRWPRELRLTTPGGRGQTPGDRPAGCPPPCSPREGSAARSAPCGAPWTWGRLGTLDKHRD